MKINYLITCALSFPLILTACQPVSNGSLIPYESKSVREDSALYNQIVLFTQKNGGIPQKDSDGFTLYTPFFNEKMIDVSVSEKEYLQKFGMFINNETIKAVRVIGYIPSSQYEQKMANILESIEKTFKETGVIAPVTLTIASPREDGRQNKRFEINVLTN